MIVIPNIDGHVILYCKSHYRVPNIDFLTGLRRIWATRCGLANEHVESKETDRYIANSLFKLLQILLPEKMSYFHEIIHEQLEYRNPWYTKDLTTMELLITIYASELSGIQVKEQKGKRYFSLVKLPSPKKKVFQRIVSGKGKYSDYKLIT